MPASARVRGEASLVFTDAVQGSSAIPTRPSRQIIRCGRPGFGVRTSRPCLTTPPSDSWLLS
jgi:hypothetical protein